MSRDVKRLIGLSSVALGVIAAVIVINQLVQFAQFARTLHPLAGDLVSIALLLLAVAAIGVPVALLLRLPPPLIAPSPDDAAAVEAHLNQLRLRLAKNPALTGSPIDLTDRSGVEAALRILDAQADQLIKRTASTVFVSTAISQNGRLDALMVLAAQLRLVWQVAHRYHQRPHWRELLHLYSQVAVTTLLVSEIEDLDISEQIEPVVAAVLGSGAVGVIPGVGAIVANILVDSLLEGTANAFLTLRIGSVTKQYCGALTQLEKKTVRRSATVAAAALLGSIVRESAGVVTKAVVGAAGQMGSRSADAAKRGVAAQWQRLKGRAGAGGASAR